MAKGEASSRTVAFHPPLVAAFPVLAVFSANTGLFPIHDLTRPLLVALGAGLVLWLLCSLLRWSFERGALLASFLLVGIWISRKIIGHFEAAVWMMWILPVVLGVIGFALSRKAVVPTRFLNRFALLLVVVSSVSIGLHARGGSVAPQVMAGKVAATKPPDIFFLLLDGYGRADQLERVMGWDNSPFLNSLERSGFLVMDQNKSNYCQTALSLGSMLNLDFIQKILPDAKKNDSDRSRAVNLVNRPLVVRELRSAGYESIAISTGFPSFDFAGFDLVVTEVPPVTYFESVLLEFMPSGPEGYTVESQFDARRHFLKTAFAELRRLGPPTAKPRFVFAHILAPHPPFVFDGEEVTPKPLGGYNFFDGSDYMTFVGTPITYTKGYRGQIEWVNSRVGELVKSLLSRPGPKPIILLQGDHGSKRGLDQNDMSKTDLKEAMSPLAAYYVPDSIRSQIKATTTPVNVMRLVTGLATGKKVELLPDRSFYSPFALPYDFTDVTDR